MPRRSETAGSKFTIGEDSQMMQSRIMPLQKYYAYGPVVSRRFGRSLGINLLPVEEKLCNFNCVYCQYGWTDRLKMRKFEFPKASLLIPEITRKFEALCLLKEKIDAVTFSGNGEPTLHPEFETLVPVIRRLRDQFLPQARLVILSNSSQIHKESVQRALISFDECYMKLDAGDEMTFFAVNNPIRKKGSWDLIIEGLKKIPRLTLQSLFISYPVNNASGFRFRSWLELVKLIKPYTVHIYSLDRAPAYPKARPVSRGLLLKLAARVESAAKVPAEVF